MPVDPLPILTTKAILVKPAFRGERGHEETIYRIADYRVSEEGGACRSKHDGLKISYAKHLKAMEQENARLK